MATSYPDRARQPIVSPRDPVLAQQHQARMRLALDLKGCQDQKIVKSIAKMLTEKRGYGLTGDLRMFDVLSDKFTQEYGKHIRHITGALRSALDRSKTFDIPAPTNDAIQQEFDALRETVLDAIDNSSVRKGFDKLVLYHGKTEDQEEGLVAIIACEAHEITKDDKDFTIGSVAAYILRYHKKKGFNLGLCWGKPRTLSDDEDDVSFNHSVPLVAIDRFGTSLLQIDCEVQEKYPLTNNQQRHQKIDLIQHAFEPMLAAAGAARPYA